MEDSIRLSLFLLAATIFGAWNLYRGLVTGRTWTPAIFRIERQSTPWSYWIAISFLAVFTVAMAIKFICEVSGFSITTPSDHP